jgi:Bacterial Ig-like domain (group 3)/Dockerin type I domain
MSRRLLPQPPPSVPFSSDAQTVPLKAKVTSAAGAVDNGTETFTILSSGTRLGTPVTVSVAAGAASAIYALPAGTPAGTYTIEADYNGTPNFARSSDSNHSLTVTAADVVISAVSVKLGSQTVALQTASDGLRLLPAGRNTDIPWFNIKQVSITLSQSADLNPSDVSVTGIIGGNYGPVTISGSGTSDMIITFAKAISGPDRVTITIGNSEIITYTRRLDVLPGDVNDDGVVNTTDGVLILRNFTPAHAYNVFDDLNGDGAVNMTDFDLYRPQIGTVLPELQPQLAIGGIGPGGAALLTTDELAPVLTAAIEDWAAAGLPAQDVARLRGVSAQITDLPAGYLGAAAIDGNTIYLSADADGYGWFIDTTAGRSSAFAQPVARTERVADPSAAPVGHEDLLTVVMHELGHTLGLNDLDPVEFSTDLMTETLATGTRRLPSAFDVATVIGKNVVGPRAPTGGVVVDAVFDADNAEALSRPPAPSLVTTARAERDATKERMLSRKSTKNGSGNERPQGKRLVVMYQPEAPTSGNGRINDVVIGLTHTEKARV